MPALIPLLGKILWGGVKIGGTIAAWEYVREQLGLDPTTPPPADENELAQFAKDHQEALTKLQNDPQIQQAIQQQGQQQGPMRDPNSLQGQANQLTAEASQLPDYVDRLGGSGSKIRNRTKMNMLAQAGDKVRKAGIQDRNDSRDFGRAKTFWDNPLMADKHGTGAMINGGWEDLDEKEKRRFSDWVKAGMPSNRAPKFDTPEVATTPAPVTPTTTATPTTNPADPAAPAPVDPNAPPSPENVPDIPVDTTSDDRGAEDTTSNAYANEVTEGDDFNWFNDREFQDPKVLEEALKHAKTLPVEKRKPFINQIRSKFEEQRKKELDESNSDISDAIDGGMYDKTLQWITDPSRFFNSDDEDSARRSRERWDAETKSDIDKRNKEIEGKFAQIEAHIKEAEQGGALYEEAPAAPAAPAAGNPGSTGPTGPAGSPGLEALPASDPFDEPQVKTGEMRNAFFSESPKLSDEELVSLGDNMRSKLAQPATNKSFSDSLKRNKAEYEASKLKALEKSLNERDESFGNRMDAIVDKAYEDSMGPYREKQAAKAEADLKAQEAFEKDEIEANAHQQHLHDQGVYGIDPPPTAAQKPSFNAPAPAPEPAPAPAPAPAQPSFGGQPAPAGTEVPVPEGEYHTGSNKVAFAGDPPAPAPTPEYVAPGEEGLPHERYVTPGEQLPGMEGVDDLPGLPELPSMDGVGDTGDYKVFDEGPENLYRDPEDYKYRPKTSSEIAKEKEMDEAWANRNNAPAEPEISPEMEDAWANRTAPDPFEGVDDLPGLPELPSMANVESPEEFRPIDDPQVQEEINRKRWVDARGQEGNQVDPWDKEIAPYRQGTGNENETWKDRQARKDRNSELRWKKDGLPGMTEKDAPWVAKKSNEWLRNKINDGVDYINNKFDTPQVGPEPETSKPERRWVDARGQRGNQQRRWVDARGQEGNQTAPTPAPAPAPAPAPKPEYKPRATATFVGNDGQGGQTKEAISWHVPGASKDLQRRIDEANMQSYLRQNKAKINAASEARKQRLNPRHMTANTPVMASDAMEDGISSDGAFRPTGTMANNTIQRPKGATDFDQPTTTRIGEDPKKKKKLRGRELATPWA